MTGQYSISDLKERFMLFYPDYKTRAYFLPPVIINRIPLESVTIANQTVLKLKSSESPSKPNQTKKSTTLGETSGTGSNHPRIVSPDFQHSDFREDLSLQLVISRLQSLAVVQNEAMFVLSQLDFSDYLSKPCYSRTIKQLNFKLPRHLTDKNYKRGDFDLLLFHKRYGVLIGEIKSVGSPYIQQKHSQITHDSDISGKVKLAIKQLDKAEAVIRELTKDLEPNLRIVKTIILPYIWRKDLQRVITADVQLQKDFVNCLNAENGIHALDLCLLSDNLAECNGSWDTQQMKTWWERHASNKEEPVMTDDLYLDIVVRFCGPATTIRLPCVKSPRLEVRTKGDGVSVVGERMTQMILTPEQVELLYEMPRNVLLCGPPGTGKTVVLELMALKCLYRGDDVYVISTVPISIAASLALKEMLDKAIAKATEQHGDVHYLQANFKISDDEATKIITIFKEVPKEKCVLAIVDEVWATNECLIERHVRCISELLNHNNINIWAVCLRHDRVPPGLRGIPMTTPLRSPPKVLKEVEKSCAWYTEEKVFMYKETSFPSPCDGSDIIHLHHSGHSKPWPIDCEECGRAVAVELKGIGIGKANDNNAGDADTKIIKAPALTYGDVFVLTGSTNLHPCGFVTGLRESGIHEVRVLLTDCSTEERKDLALARNNEVIVSWFLTVIGLERKVVVYLPHRNEFDDGVHTDEELQAYGMISAMSRCTSQLIVVHTPPF